MDRFFLVFRLAFPHLQRSVLLFLTGVGGIFFLGVVSPAIAAVDQTTAIDDDYRLSTGDSINIHVFQEPDLTVKLKVSDTGTISYPLLGDIKVQGLTRGQMAKLLTERLKGDYLVDPRISISIVDYRQFYVNGEIVKPGAYSYVPGLTVRKAITIAGGFKDRADRDGIVILRGTQADKPIKAGFNNKVYPGDIITVEQSFF